MATAAENKLAKKKRLLDSAYKLFINKSFSSTAIDDVVRAAGVAKGTFYLYFKDKYDLFDQIVADKSAGVIGKAIEEIEKREDFPSLSLSDKALLITDHVTDFLMKNKEICALLNKNLSRCFKYITSDENKEYTAMLDKITNAFISAGFSEDRAMASVYLITETVGSVCCDIILGTVPFSFDTVYPGLRSIIRNLTEVTD